MRIAYIGNRKNKASDGKSFNTENHIALTLEKLGHQVIFLQEDELQPGWQRLVNDCDFMLWTRTWKGNVTINDLLQIRVPTVSFHLDKYTGIARDGGLADDAFWRTDYVFSPEGSDEAKQVFKELNINQFYLPAGVFEDECYMAKPEVQYMHDVVFVGGGSRYAHPEWPYRAQLVKWLEETYGPRFKKYGWPEETVRGEELNKLYASCKVVVGDSLCKDFKDEYYFSDRIFETTGRGGFIIHPYIKGLEAHFNILGKTTGPTELITYDFGDFTQLKSLIDFYLENDKIRNKIRERGFKRTKTTNTYTNRMKEMINVLKEQNAI